RRPVADRVSLPSGSCAAAIRKISRSPRRIRCSRRRRRSSPCSSLVSPSLRLPASSSACLSQRAAASRSSRPDLRRSDEGNSHWYGPAEWPPREPPAATAVPVVMLWPWTPPRSFTPTLQVFTLSGLLHGLHPRVVRLDTG